jgi:hypothetical protein
MKKYQDGHRTINVINQIPRTNVAMLTTIITTIITFAVAITIVVNITTTIARHAHRPT